MADNDALIAIHRRLDMIDAKLNLIARSIGGVMLRREWTKLERRERIPDDKLTFPPEPKAVPK